MPRLRTFIGMMFIGILLWILPPSDLAQRVLDHILISAFTQAGYPDVRYDVTQLSFTHLKIENVQLEPEAISTIDSIDISFTPFGILRGKFEHVSLTHPDLVFAPESPPPFTRSIFVPFLDLSSFPVRTLDVKDITISYAGDETTFSVTGSLSMTTTADHGKKAFFSLSGSQKDLSLDINGSVTLDPQGRTKIDSSILRARIQTPFLSLTRMNGDVAMIFDQGRLVSLGGKINAGGFRYGKAKFNNFSGSFSTTHEDILILVEGDMADVPMTNLSVRLTQKGAGGPLSGLAQISGPHADRVIKSVWKEYATGIAPQQKFALTYVWDGDTVQDFFSNVLTGRLFLYGTDPNPILSFHSTCKTILPLSCTFLLPKTSLTPDHGALKIASPFFAQKGIFLRNGIVDVSGIVALSPHDGITLDTLSLASQEAEITWQNLSLRRLNAYATWDYKTGGVSLKYFSAQGLQGLITLEPFDTTGQEITPLILTARDIDLSEMTRFIGVKGLTLIGTGRARILMLYKNKTISFQNPVRLSAENGVLSYLPDLYPSFLSGKSKRQSLLRNALYHYKFRTLDLILNKDGGKTVHGTLSLTGKAPHLYGDQDVDISIKGNGFFPSSLRTLVPEL